MIFYSVAMIAAGTLAAIGYAQHDVRYALGAGLIVGLAWTYDALLRCGPPE